MFFYGIGHAMVDYFFDTSNMRILPAPLKPGEAVHLESDDFTRLLDDMDAPDSESRRSRDFFSPDKKQAGGAVFNALKTARVFGTGAHFSGSCGKLPARDDDAVFFQDEAGRAGVSSRLATRELPSGRCLVARSSRRDEWAIAASPGSAPLIEGEQFEERAADGADCIVIEGTQCGNAALAERAAALYAERKKPLALLCATPYGAERAAAFLGNLARTERFRAETPEAAPPVFVFANRREGAIAGGAARALPNCVYIQTDGAAGGAVRLPKAFSAADDGGAFLRFAAAPLPSRAVDETGAGDVFAGTFLALWFQRGVFPPDPGELQNICARAAKAAAAVTTVPLCDVSVIKT